MAKGENTNDFRQYLEEKFRSLEKKLDGMSSANTSDFIEIRKRIDTQEEKIDWINNRVWLAMGAVAVLGVASTTILFSFRSINEQQIREVVRQELRAFTNN